MKVLGISASLRNIRHAVGGDGLAAEIRAINSLEHLREYLTIQGKFGLGAFHEAGRKEGQPFTNIHRRLRKSRGAHGLSNSEIMLAAGLWGAQSNGAEISHVSLADFFGDSRAEQHDLDKLLAQVHDADALLLSGPVYFGDRSSLAHDFLQLLRHHPDSIRNKVFGGISVGAKRNGGQETCLIYQMLDFMSAGMLGVGNDAGTTAQYGGTGHAGDIGAGAADDYGIRTAVGTGNRLAQVLRLMNYAKSSRLRDRPRIGIVILQDVEERAKAFVERKILDSKLAGLADFRFLYLPDEFIKRCIACDMCPQTIGRDEDYRCIIRSRQDLFRKYHEKFLGLDAMLLGGYSPDSCTGLRSVYQSFMERTRYLRRSDYIFSNILMAPLVIQEVGSRENFHIRIHTSTIRHHTVMHRPILFYEDSGRFHGEEKSFGDLADFIETASTVTAGRILDFTHDEAYANYMPFGYTLSSMRDREPETMARRRENIENRQELFRRMSKERLKPCSR